MQLKSKSKPIVVSSYKARELGAPFEVVLINSVCVKPDRRTNEDIVTIPDLPGLVAAIVRRRVCDPRKLSPEDIRFIRKAIGVRSRKVANFLGVTPEHYSRYEAGSYPMPSASERAFRLSSFAASLVKDPEQLFDDAAGPSNLEFVSDRAEELQKLFFKVFVEMKIRPARSATDEVRYEFVRLQAVDPCVSDAELQGDWRDAA